MEKMDGGELMKQMEKQGVYTGLISYDSIFFLLIFLFAERQCRNVLVQVARALQYAHSKGVAHRCLSLLKKRVQFAAQGVCC